ncbi:unnamed protein product, partial [Brassica oleracea]
VYNCLQLHREEKILRNLSLSAASVLPFVFISGRFILYAQKWPFMYFSCTAVFLVAVCFPPLCLLLLLAISKHQFDHLPLCFCL